MSAKKGMVDFTLEFAQVGIFKHFVSGILAPKGFENPLGLMREVNIS